MRQLKITKSTTNRSNPVYEKVCYCDLPKEESNSDIATEEYEKRRREREMELRKEAKSVVGKYHPHFDGPDGPLYDPDDPELDDYPEMRQMLKEDLARAEAQYEKDIEAYIQAHLEEEFKRNEKTIDNKVQRRNSFLRKIFKKI